MAEEVVAGGGEHGVDRVALGMGEVVSAHPVLGFQMADRRGGSGWGCAVGASAAAGSVALNVRRDA